MKVTLILGGEVQIEAEVRSDLIEKLGKDLVSITDLASAALHNKAEEIQKAGEHPPDYWISVPI